MPTAADARIAHELRIACLRLARRVRQHATTMPPHFFSVLAHAEHGATTAVDIASCERVSAASMSRTVGELVERGLITRQRDADDRRRQILTLTDAGRDAISAARQERDAWTATALSRVSAEERTTLAAAARIIERMLADDAT